MAQALPARLLFCACTGSNNRSGHRILRLGFEDDDKVNNVIRTKRHYRRRCSLAIHCTACCRNYNYGYFVRYVVKLDITHGIDKILLKIKKHLYDIKSRVIIAPMIASSFTLGFGGSAGSEGPIATTGAAIGSNAARIFGLPQSMMLLMIGCGAGAGIAGIFKSPMGGFLFTLEVMRLELSTLSVITLLASTITAAMTAFVLSGCSIDLAFNGAHVF